MDHPNTITTFTGPRNHGLQVGYNSGNIETHVYAPVERSETPPCPSLFIPFRRDVDFVVRETILDLVDQKCTVLGSWTALVGLGGVGKSQLAIEYCYRTRDLWPKTWVFWVHASNAARFEQGYRDIADSVKIFRRQDPQANIFKLVHDWLRSCKERWLLVLDNVDDARFLLDVQAHGRSQAADSKTPNSKTASRPLREYIPFCERGSILITTRSKDAALKLVEQRDIVPVEPMDEEQALGLLKKKLGAHEVSCDTAKLAAALEYMPLAIVQAATYISQRGCRCSVTQYLAEFEKSERKKTSLLNCDKRGGEVQFRRDLEATNSIIVTWQISFEHIQQIRPSAADLLSLMSFFDRQGIPDALLRNRTQQDDVDNDNWDSDKEDDASQSSSGEVEFENDILTLCNFSFILIDANGTFEMHRLVQVAMREWLRAHGQLEKWKRHFIRSLRAEFPTGAYENWIVCQTLFPHAKSAAAQRPEETDTLREWAVILYRAAWYALRKGNIIEAEIMAVQAMKARKKILGRDHEATLWSMILVAEAYHFKGRWDTAEELGLQVMETRKKKLGEDHPGTLASMSILALTYWNQGRWDAAEELGLQVMETHKKKLGEGHPSTLTSISNLALTYCNQGRWDAAEELGLQVMETRKKKLGEDHPGTLASMSNLALTYWNQGRWDAAEELGLQVIETSKKKLGEDHPGTLASMSNLVSTYRVQGRWDAAEELGLQVIETSKKKLGEGHPGTLTSISNLVLIYLDQGRRIEAEELGMKTMASFKKVLGVEHPKTLSSLACLTLVYADQGRWKDSEELGVQVKETRERVLGLEHPDTLTSIDSLASTFSNQGRWNEAEELCVKVIEARKRMIGSEHPDTFTSIDNLASIYRNQGRGKEAEELCVQVLEMRKKVLGLEHPKTLTSMANLAFTLKSLRHDEEAISLMLKCFQLRKQKLGFQHPDTQTSLEALNKWTETETIET